MGSLFPGKVCQIKDWMALSLLAQPSRRLKGNDLLYEIVAVFSRPVFSGGTILFAVFRLYKPQHVLPKYPPYFRSISRKEKEFQFYSSNGEMKVKNRLLMKCFSTANLSKTRGTRKKLGGSWVAGNRTYITAVAEERKSNFYPVFIKRTIGNSRHFQFSEIAVEIAFLRFPSSFPVGKSLQLGFPTFPEES